MGDLVTALPQDFTIGVGTSAWQGWRQRFGIVHVDRETQVRTPRPGAHWLGALQARRRSAVSG